MNIVLKNAFLAMAADPSCTAAEKRFIVDFCSGKFASAQPQTLIRRREVLQLLGVSEPTLRKYVRDGWIKEIRQSARKIRFAREQVLDFLHHGQMRHDLPQPSHVMQAEAL